MAMTKMGFARLVAYVQLLIAKEEQLQDHQIERIDYLINVDYDQQNIAQPKMNNAELDRLLMLMQQGTQKIEAIKAYRMLTGAMLKEAKDAVERHWIDKRPKNEPAKLSDILGNSQ